MSAENNPLGIPDYARHRPTQDEINRHFADQSTLTERITEALLNGQQMNTERGCENCAYFKSQVYHDLMWCRDCQQGNHFKQKNEPK